MDSISNLNTGQELKLIQFYTHPYLFLKSTSTNVIRTRRIKTLVVAKTDAILGLQRLFALNYFFFFFLLRKLFRLRSSPISCRYALIVFGK